MSANDILFYILIPVIIGVILLVDLILFLVSKNRNTKMNGKNDQSNDWIKNRYIPLKEEDAISANNYFVMFGESEVDQILKEIQEEADGEVYKNIILEDKYNNYTEIDNIYVSICGIFIIETKAWSGNVEGGHYDNEWEIVLGNGDIIHRQPNPFKQNERYVKFFKELFILNAK